jgi:hypothetical protein
MLEGPGNWKWTEFWKSIGWDFQSSDAEDMVGSTATVVIDDGEYRRETRSEIKVWLPKSKVRLEDEPQPKSKGPSPNPTKKAAIPVDDNEETEPEEEEEEEEQTESENSNPSEARDEDDDLDLEPVPKKKETAEAVNQIKKRLSREK